VSLFEIILSVIALVVLLPLGASLLMAVIIDNTDNEGLYDELDS
jgi:hypothetical protein